MSSIESHYQTIVLEYDYSNISIMSRSDKKIAIAERNRKALRYWKDSLGLSVAGWCSKAGISEGTLRNFLSGHSQTIEIDTLHALAEAIGKSIGELLDGPFSNKGAEEALIYANKVLIKLLLNSKKPVTREDLRKDFTFALDLFRDSELPGAAAVMDDLLGYVEGSRPQEKSPKLRKVLRLSPPV